MNHILKYFDSTNNQNVNSTTVSNSKTILYCNYYSFYSQKVLMALYEKDVDFEPVIIDITKGEQYSPWFLEINHRGEIPVLQIGKQIIPDSTRILDYLEQYLDTELQPLINVGNDPKVLNKITKYRDLIDALPAGVITIGSFFHPHLCGRPKLPFILPVREVLKNGDLNSAQNLRKIAEENPKARPTLLYKAEILDRKHQLVTDEDEYKKILNVVDNILSEVEEELSSQPADNWLCCEQFTIADINLTVLLQRLWELGLEDRFWSKGKRPFVERYLNRVRQRESYKKAIPNFQHHIKMIINSQPPVVVGCTLIIALGVVIGAACAIRKVIH